ncbi:MAG: hypothetical protein JNL82_30570 [Myxococcales bacterium]|nr:hypothetical protein [Myxococcales bacterium]
MLAASLWLGLALGAPGEQLDLRWSAPDECPASSFHAALARYRDPAAPHAPMRVQADVRRDRREWTLDLAVDGGTRRLTADRCEVVVDAAAFVVAQAMGAAPIPPPPEPAPEPPRPEPPPEPATPEPPPEPATREPLLTPDLVEPLAAPAPPRVRPRPWAALRLRGGLSGAALPGVAAALGLVAGLAGERWRAELTALGRLPHRTPTADPAVSARLAMWAIGARGCGVPRARRLDFPLCAGLELGQERGRSVGLTPDGSAARVWAAAVASASLAHAPRPWLALVLEVELAVPLVRRDWLISGLAPVHHTGPVDLRGFAGLEFRPGARAP